MPHIAVVVAVAVVGALLLPNAVDGALFVDRVLVVVAVLARDALVLACRVLVTGAELGLWVATVMAIAAGAELGDAVLRALAVDRVLVVLAPLTANAAVLVERVLRAELGLRVAVMVAIAGRQQRGGAVLRALAVDGVVTFGAEGAGDASVLEALDFGAELRVGVALVMLVAVGADLRDAMLRALLVDRILVVMAVVARHTGVLVSRLVGAKLRLLIAVVVLTACRPERRDAVVRAVLVDAERVLAAVLARDTLAVEIAALFAHQRNAVNIFVQDFQLVAGAELALRVAVVVLVALSLGLGDAVCWALLVDREFGVRAELAWRAFEREIVAVELADLVDLRGGAELGAAAPVVAVTFGALRRDAVAWAVVVDRVLRMLAELACHTLVLAPLDVRTELALAVAVVVAVTVRVERRDAVLRALVVE